VPHDDGQGGQASGGSDEVMVGQIRAGIVDAVQELDELHAAAEAEVQGRQSSPQKISPNVFVPALNGYVNKMRLVAEMNLSSGKLPVDRLQRVRHQGADPAIGEAQVIDSGGAVGLFDNICVCVVGDDGLWSWFLAKVLVMTD
jgi:hypothetical protein